jgi:hypothetical protein
MLVIRLWTPIAASPERVFDLARSIDAHQDSAEGTQERAVAGVTGGLIGVGEEVTWEAGHFGIKQRLTVRITRFERPARFQDVMVFPNGLRPCLGSKTVPSMTNLAVPSRDQVFPFPRDWFGLAVE